MGIPTKKNVNAVKMLAFERLMLMGKTPLEIRERLDMGRRTYYRYLSHYRESREKS